MAIAILLLTMLLDPPPAWTFDEFVHANGSTFRGLIVRESAEGVRFQVVTRRPGRPTVTLTTLFTPAEVGSLRRLPDNERAILKKRLAELDPSGAGERSQMAAITFKSAEWLGKADGAKSFASDHFELITDANDEIARRAAVRLELLAAALTRYFPPVKREAGPTAVLLCTRPEDYATHLRGRAILNPAIFDPDANRIICGSHLKALSDQLAGTRLHHERQRRAIDEYETGVRRLYRDSKADLERFLAAIAAERKRIDAAETANDLAFDRSTKQLFALLYHEAFHAYGRTSGHPILPRWLDEGLAQVFESAVIEAGELHVDTVDPARLKAFLADPVPLKDVLTAKPSDFIATHAGQRQASERVYRGAYVHAYMLLVDRPIIGTDRFRTFVRTSEGGDPVAAFENWAGMTAAEWDRFVVRRLTAMSSSGAKSP
jgi:hypothetical protein